MHRGPHGDQPEETVVARTDKRAVWKGTARYKQVQGGGMSFTLNYVSCGDKGGWRM